MECPAVSLVLLVRLASAWRGGPSIGPWSWPCLSAGDLAPCAWGVGFGMGQPVVGLVRHPSGDGRGCTVGRCGVDADERRGPGWRDIALGRYSASRPGWTSSSARPPATTRRWRSSGHATGADQTADHPARLTGPVIPTTGTDNAVTAGDGARPADRRGRSRGGLRTPRGPAVGVL